MEQEQTIYKGKDRSITTIFGGQSEVTLREKHKWPPCGEQGTFMLIEKEELRLDLSYQRDATSRRKILKIAREFDWQAFGVITVSMRRHGFFVTDGGHRLRAAELRDDINKLPCIVFNGETIEDEANAFLTQNTMVSNVSPYAKFRAKLVAGDEVAQKVQKVFDHYGYAPAAGTGAPKTTAAIAAILDAASRDMSAFKVTFDLCVEIADEACIPAAVFRGLFYLISKGCPEVATRTYRKKLVYLGMDVINQQIIRNKHMTGGGGVVIEARSILQVVNKGRRSRRLELPEGVPNKADSTDSDDK